MFLFRAKFSRDPRGERGQHSFHSAFPWRVAAKLQLDSASRRTTMWVRQCELDAQAEATLPIPAQIASNEEFIPPPQSPQQKEYEARLVNISEDAARRQGLSRRDFLRTGSGTAAALLALNQVFGDCYDVSAAEVEDQKAFEEKWPKDQ